MARPRKTQLFFIVDHPPSRETVLHINHTTKEMTAKKFLFPWGRIAELLPWRTIPMHCSLCERQKASANETGALSGTSFRIDKGTTQRLSLEMDPLVLGGTVRMTSPRKRAILSLASPFLVLLSIAFASTAPKAADPFSEKRRAMVEKDLKGRGVKDAKVLDAMAKIPRHLFVEESLSRKAYADSPLPIAEGQTISQPYVVALMTEALKLRPEERVLEIGTGSGYQAAVLAEIVREVYTIEIRKPLAEAAQQRLKGLGYANVNVKYGDGYFGWEEHAPFDAIIITASVNHIPPPLIKQLKEGGRIILPLGSTLFHQTLTLATKVKGELDVEQMGAVAFVPMTGEAEKKR
jgi:protein-L-isoaspartate(D-aspartate) O-methyltransferase